MGAQVLDLRVTTVDRLDRCGPLGPIWYELPAAMCDVNGVEDGIERWHSEQ